MKNQLIRKLLIPFCTLVFAGFSSNLYAKKSSTDTVSVHFQECFAGHKVSMFVKGDFLFKEQKLTTRGESGNTGVEVTVVFHPDEVEFIYGEVQFFKPLQDQLKFEININGKTYFCSAKLRKFVGISYCGNEITTVESSRPFVYGY